MLTGYPAAWALSESPNVRSASDLTSMTSHHSQQLIKRVAHYETRLNRG